METKVYKVTDAEVKAIRLALEIADDHAASIIDCFGRSICDSIGRRLWMAMDPNDTSDGWEVSRAMRYLSLRGKLRRRPSNPNHVKVAR